MKSFRKQIMMADSIPIPPPSNLSKSCSTSDQSFAISPFESPASFPSLSLPENPSSAKPPSSPPTVTNISKKPGRPFEFGQRHLTESANTFDFNAWDNVTPPASHLLWAESQYALQRSSPVSTFDAVLFNTDPARWWNRFYANNTANFFKDRKWLWQEFPILQAVTASGAGSKRVLEIGAGAGNTAFPILRTNENPDFRLFACDFSRRAVELIRSSPAFDPLVMQAEVWDFSSPGDLPNGVEECSIDVVLLIFTFSNLSPRQWAQAVSNVWRVLKPGGEICFRDYGRGDLAQIRFRKGRWLEENFYVRGDGTRVYFFDEDELRRIWGGGQGGESEAVQDERVGGRQEWTSHDQEIIERQEHQGNSSVDQLNIPSFEILDLGVDRRLTVNRKEQLKMYRCWMQGRFRKPLLQDPSALREEHMNISSSSNSNQNDLSA